MTFAYSSPNKVYLVTRLDRIWHWIHALGVVLLILTGFQIHFVEKFPVFGSYAQALEWHNVAGIVVIFDWGLWFLYNVLSGRFSLYYRPNREDLLSGIKRQGAFYARGIFKGEPHPFAAGKTRKFNPPQKWTYLGVMLGLIPFQIITGLYLYSMVTGLLSFDGARALPVSVLHNAAGFLVAAFLISHVYLGTTGRKPWSQFRLMITGYHDDEQANR